MALVTSIVILSNGVSGDSDVRKFLNAHYPLLGDVENLGTKSSGAKCCEIDIRAIGMNYLDVGDFYRRFESFEWHDLPTLVVCEQEGDMLTITVGDETRVRDEGDRAQPKAGG